MTKRRVEAIVIGASAGAIDALSTLLPTLPGNFGLPILIVVHLPSDKKSVIAELLQLKCTIRIKEAEDKEPIESGVVYFAPPDYHLLVEPSRLLSLSTEEPELYSRPSINVLFETAAEAYGANLLGVILTGANEDGTRGLRAILDAGGLGVIQDPAEAYAHAMPQSALMACPEARIFRLQEISTYLKEGIVL